MMPEKAPGEILPLPLVPFEEYMLLDDRPAYPMSFFCRLRFSGRFDRPALESAIGTAAGRHPLLTARVRKSGRRRFEWVSAGDSPPVQWLPKPDSDDLPRAAPLDLHKEGGLRLWVLEGDRAADVVMQFHHSCCDGLGALQFMEDLLVAYALATAAAPDAAALRPKEPWRLRRRGAFGLTPWKFLRMLPKQLVGLIGAWQFLTCRPAPLVPHEPDPDAATLPQRYPAAHTRCFDRAESAALRTVARRHEVTVNEVLARDLFLAIGEWRTRQGVEDDAWLRLSVPVSLRTAADRRLPAANVVSMVFLDRRPREFADPDRLLEGIHLQMDQIKRLQLGLTFVLSLRVASMFPGGLARQIRVDRCTASGVFTNLSTVFARVPLPRREGRIVAGSVVLEGMDCLAPIRPHTCSAFTAFKYAGKLGVTLHYDGRPLSAGQAEDLLDTFMGRVRESIRAGS